MNIQETRMKIEDLTDRQNQIEKELEDCIDPNHLLRKTFEFEDECDKLRNDLSLFVEKLRADVLLSLE
jgi:hypothetical protein